MFPSELFRGLEFKQISQICLQNEINVLIDSSKKMASVKRSLQHRLLLITDKCCPIFL